MSDHMVTLDGYVINEIQLYGGGPYDVANVVLQRRRQLEGKDRWAIVDMGAVLDKDGDWITEPLPSSRTDEYLNSTRFGTPDEAITFWRQLDKPTRFWRHQPEFGSVGGKAAGG